MAYVVTAEWRSKPGKENRLVALIEELTLAARAEEGNLVFQPHRAVDDPRVFFFYEQYVDEAAFGAHMASDHFTRLVIQEAVAKLLMHRERAFYRTIPDDRRGGDAQDGGLAGDMC